MILLLTFFIGMSVCAKAQKKIYIPEDLRQMNLESDTSKWCWKRSAETRDCIFMWERGFGNDLQSPPQLDGKPMAFNLSVLMDRVQSFYSFYRDTLGFTLPGSKADRYKMMVMLNYSLEGTAYGGCYDDSIGALWIAPNRVQDNRLNCIAHELGHSFQIQISCDGWGHGPGGGFFEMTSQWMLWNVNPEWPTDENYHWKNFIKQANLPFLAGENIYCSPYMLEYWSMKHGLDVIAGLYRESRRREDAAQTYMRMFDLTNEQFACEALDCYSRLLSFDFPGKHEVNKRYAGEFLNDKPLGTFGANSIEIKSVKMKNGKAKVSFVGDKDKGYAYRLVALNDKAEATYGDICTKQKGTATLCVPADAKSVYLVVTAYPLGEYKPREEVSYPYTFK